MAMVKSARGDRNLIEELKNVQYAKDLAPLLKDLRHGIWRKTREVRNISNKDSQILLLNFIHDFVPIF